MDDEFDAVSSCHSDFEKSSCFISTDEHDEVIMVEYSDGVAVGVQHLMVGNPVLSGAIQNYGVHPLKLS